MAKPKLALIPAAQGSKFYSVLPSDGTGDFTFGRASAATRINKYGYIETVASSKSRLNYPLIDGVVKGCPHYLLEPARTNLFLYSQSLETGWSSAGTNPPVLTASQFISPDGSQNASRLQIPSTGTTSIFYQLFSHTLGTQYTISAYVKSNTSTNQEFKLYGDFGSPSAISGVLTATSEWQRFSFTYTATATGSRSGGFYYVPNTAADLQVYGIQVETGSYSTSFIPTTNSTVTRVAETANGSGDASTFNDSEGVLMVEAAALANDGTNRRISISDGSTSDRIVIGYTSASNQLLILVSSNSVSGISALVNIQNSLQFNKLSLKYKLNDVSFFVNGFKVLTDNSVDMPIGLNDLSFEGSEDLYDLYGSIKQLQYYDLALTDSELETLTSWVSFQDMAEGQLYTIE